MKTLFGDLHNHCGISYGYGSLENALTAAKEQLDFCAIIGHAQWHDIPNDPDLRYLIDYHQRGFEKLREHWSEVRQLIENAHRPGSFVTFQGYEAHSSQYGDHHIVSPDDNLPLRNGDSPSEIISNLQGVSAIAIPHHVGYGPGYRGGNWKEYNEVISPVVEVYSKHGCGLSESSPYPYYHSMGPRDRRGTVRNGLKQGLKFGFIASTDHHAGYPGSYGDGRVAVLAADNTREAIWDALLKRRTYAVTGDKIQCDFQMNGHDMGSEVFDTTHRYFWLKICGSDAIDRLILYKNGRPWKWSVGNYLMSNKPVAGRAKVRVEMGWGESNEFTWNGRVQVINGQIKSLEPCFRGRSVLAPEQGVWEQPEINRLENHVQFVTHDEVVWTCTSLKNISTLHPQTQAIVLEVDNADTASLIFDINGVMVKCTLRELFEGNIVRHIKEYNSEAFLIHKAVPSKDFELAMEIEDIEKQQECDVYDVEIQQRNGQFAWLSPIYVH